MAQTVTTTIDGKTITKEEFYKQAVRWASMVRNTAKRNTLQFTKGKRHNSITYKSGKKAGKVERKLSASIRYSIEHSDHIPESIGFKIPIHGIWREWGGRIWPAACSGQVREPAPAHTQIYGGLA